MENYKISIAMATYNGAKYIAQQIESILDQSLRPVEIIVCDDRSTDDTVKILETYKSRISLKIVVNERSLGVINNFSHAISLCTSPYIALSDQDDVWMNEKLELSAARMNEIEKDRSKPSLVFSDLELVNDSLQTMNPSLWRQLNADPQKDSFYTLMFGNVVTGCTMFINQPMASKLTSIPSAAIMHDFWAALISFSFGQVGIIGKPLVRYRQHGQNVTNNFERSVFNRAKELIKTVTKQRKTFLMPELAQAEAFLKEYRDVLPPDRLKDLQLFLQLQKAPFVWRKWESFKTNNILRS